MKRLMFTLLVLFAIAPAVVAQTTLTANLSGANEVPPADPEAPGRS